jgi:hypothetical protein
MLLSFVILCFCFCFLVEVGFQAYLRLCKSLSEVDFIIIIFRETKLVSLGLTLAALFAYLKYFMFFV